MTNQEKIKGAIRCPVCKKEKVIAYEVHQERHR